MSGGEPKWTPGPWRREGCDEDDPDSTDVRSADRLVATAYPRCDYKPGVGYVDKRAVEQAIANARLIAAAPDLYAALTAVLPYFQGEHAHDHPHCVQLRAALAKARGEPA